MCAHSLVEKGAAAGGCSAQGGVPHTWAIKGGSGMALLGAKESSGSLETGGRFLPGCLTHSTSGSLCLRTGTAPWHLAAQAR